METIRKQLSIKKKILFPLKVLSLCHQYGETMGLFVLSLIILVSRWIGKSQYLYANDSGLYALALEHYDVSVQQPHPPGYPLYILLAKPIYLLTKDANLSLIILSIVFSILSIYAVFYLAKRIYNVRIAWLSTILLATLPLFWFHGQVALSYTSDVFFSAWFAQHIYTAIIQRNPKDLLKATLILAIGAGFRPTLLLFMLPLWLWGLWLQSNWRQRWVAVGSLLLVVLAWFLPMVYFSGGWVGYSHAFTAMFLTKEGVYKESFFEQGLSSAMDNIFLIKDNLMLNFGWASIIILLSLSSFLASTIKDAKINLINLIFWLSWILPTLVFYIFIIFSMPGYLLVIFPALVILSALAIAKFSDEIALAYTSNRDIQNIFKTNASILLVIFLTIINIFVYYQKDHQPQIQKSTHLAVTLSDQVWQDLIPTINDKFNPQNTLISIDNYFVVWGFSQLEYYFPNYPVYIRVPWGLYNPQDKKWLMAEQHTITLRDELMITPLDASLIVIRGTWGNITRDMQQGITLTSGAKLAYYDLTDQLTRKLLTKVPYINIYDMPNGDSHE